jgi:hypothetical protein
MSRARGDIDRDGVSPAGAGFRRSAIRSRSAARTRLGLEGANEIVLAYRPLDSESMLGHVGGKRAVASVTVRVGAGTFDRR